MAADNFHQYFEVQDFPGTFAKVRTIAGARHGGKVQLLLWRRPGQADKCIVGKRIKTRTVDMFLQGQREQGDDPAAEFAVYLFLRDRLPRCPNLLSAVGCWRDGQDTVLLTEYDRGCRGLFDEVCDEAIDDDLPRCATWQILQAVRYLHEHNIGHRGISLENVVCHRNDAGQFVCKLLDFGGAVLLQRGGRVSRYFELCGKDLYRAPEVMDSEPQGYSDPDIPRPAGYRAGTAVQILWRSCLYEWTFSDDARGGAELAGYEAGRIDMFAVGVVLFILMAKIPPWGQARMNDRGFRLRYESRQDWIGDLIKFGGVTQLVGQNQEAVDMCQHLVDYDPSTRWGVDQCLEIAWFNPLR